MRSFLKATKYIGFALLGLGGGTMDSASVVIPIIIAFVGLGIIVIGSTMEERMYG